MDGDFRTAFVREPGALRQNPALVLNADYRPLVLLSAEPLAMAGGGEGGVPRPGGHRGGIRRGGPKPVDDAADPQRGGPQGLRQTPEARGLHALQSFSEGRIPLPVLRRQGGSDLRPRGAARPRRNHQLGKRRGRLRALQPAQGVKEPAPAPAFPCASRRASPTRRNCATRAASFPRTTCTTAGWTSSTGMPNSKPDRPPHSAACCGVTR